MIDVDQVLRNTALIAAIAAAIGWTLNKIYDVGSVRLKAARERRTAIIRFYIDSRLRYRYLSQLLEPETLKTLQARTEAAIRAHHNEGRAFRMYSVQVTDPRAQEAVLDHLASFPPRVGELILESILLDRTMVALQEKMQSDQFEALSPDRQIAAVKDWVRSVETLVPKLSEVLADLERRFNLGQSDHPSTGAPRTERRE